MHSEAFNRAELDGVVPSSSVLNYMSRVRDESHQMREFLRRVRAGMEKGTHVGWCWLRTTGVLRRSNAGLSRALASGAETLPR